MRKGSKQKVTMVTVSARDLKKAFRQVFPEKTAQDVYPLWLRFWAGMVLAARVEQQDANEQPDITEFPDPQPIVINEKEPKES